MYEGREPEAMFPLVVDSILILVLVLITRMKFDLLKSILVLV